MNKIILSIFLVVGLRASVIKVAVAANVSYAMPKLIVAFNKIYPNIKVQVLLGSSGKLTAQIKEGAPFEVFLSANMKYPNALYKDGFSTKKPVLYARGALAILSSKRRDFKKGIFLLNEKSIKKIAIANPKTAPYGKAAVEAMKTVGIYNSLKNKLVYAQSVSQAVVYSIIASDIGFVAKSSLYSQKMKKYKKGVNWIEINQKLYAPIEQGIILLKNHTKNAKYFYDFILSQKAKQIFKSYGYIVK